MNVFYLMCLGVARVCRIFFWYTMANKADSFWYLMVADLLHTVLLGAFFYLFKYFSKSKSDILGGRKE